MKKIIFLIICIMSLIQPVKGYCFLYSDGSEGAFNASTNMIVGLPSDGIFNFTTITIDDGVIVNFNRNTANTPVYFLATGEVNIDGIINISALGAIGGPGGGNAGEDLGSIGGVPGGGDSLTFHGGSGGTTGGGGGALWLSTFNNITIGGCIVANGATEGGSGGAISLLTDSSITIGETGFLQANGMAGGNGGFISLEGNDVALLESARIETAVVPIPGAIWLFVSGFIGLFGIRKAVYYI